jgi:hypothetical protein
LRRQGPDFTPSELRAFTGGVFLLAFGLRLLLAMTSDRIVWAEEPFYLWMTGNWLNGAGYTVYQGIADIHFPPGFPLLLAFAKFFFHDLSSGILFWYVVAGTATLVPVFLLARELYDDFTALLAGLLYAVSPALLTGMAFDGHPADAPYLFFLMSGCYFLYQVFHRDPLRVDALLAGFSLSIAYLIRNEALLYFLAFLGCWLIQRLVRTEPPWKRVLTRMGLYVGSFVLLATPYVFYLHGQLSARSAEMTWTLSGGSAQSYALRSRYSTRTGSLRPGNLGAGLAKRRGPVLLDGAAGGAFVDLVFRESRGVFRGYLAKHSPFVPGVDRFELLRSGAALDRYAGSVRHSLGTQAGLAGTLSFLVSSALDRQLDFSRDRALAVSRGPDSSSLGGEGIDSSGPVEQPDRGEYEALCLPKEQRNLGESLGPFGALGIFLWFLIFGFSFNPMRPIFRTGRSCADGFKTIPRPMR